MKKLLTLLLFSFTLVVSAAQVYEPEQIWYTNEQNQGMGQGSYYKLKFNSKADLYLMDYLNNIYSGLQTETFKSLGITEYGYYLNGDKDNLFKFSTDNPTSLDNYTYYDENGKQTYNRNAYFLGNFNAGDEVEIYLSDGTTQVSSYTPVNGAYTSRYEARQDALNKSMPVAQLFMYNSTGYEVNFGLYTVADTTPIVEAGTVGSPLPSSTSTLITVLILCALVSIFYTYKKGEVL